jgi:hypothetical protein
MLNWARGGIGGDPRSLFDGTLGALVEIYLPFTSKTNIM